MGKLFCLRCQSREIIEGIEQAEFADMTVSFRKCDKCGLIHAIEMDGPDAHKFRKKAIGEFLFVDVKGLARIHWYPINKRRLRYA